MSMGKETTEIDGIIRSFGDNIGFNHLISHYDSDFGLYSNPTNYKLPLNFFHFQKDGTKSMITVNYNYGNNYEIFSANYNMIKEELDKKSQCLSQNLVDRIIGGKINEELDKKSEHLVARLKIKVKIEEDELEYEGVGLIKIIEE